MQLQVLKAIDVASEIASRRFRVEVHIMIFAFTDPEIADRIIRHAKAYPNLIFRIIADWSQGSNVVAKQVPNLVTVNLPNLRVRFSRDRPYCWDESQERLIWSYSSSRGFLHHKTLGISVDGRPQFLLIGSFNWTRHAQTGFENLIVLKSGTVASDSLMEHVENEFRAIWNCPGYSVTAHQAKDYYLTVRENIRANNLEELERLENADLLRTHDTDQLPAVSTHRNSRNSDNALIAFGSPQTNAGGANEKKNSGARGAKTRFRLAKPSGAIKNVPISITALALDAIHRAGKDDRIDVAMFALSRRSTEYNALIQAARRGLRLRIVLDSRVAEVIHKKLARLVAEERLKIEVRLSKKYMHQKYLIHASRGAVVSGTANMTRDSSQRHFENRLYLVDREVCARFEKDFHTIWNRS